MINDMKIGNLKLTEALKLLRPIAKNHGLNLSKSKDFNSARLILANLLCHDVQYEH